MMSDDFENYNEQLKMLKDLQGKFNDVNMSNPQTILDSFGIDMDEMDEYFKNSMEDDSELKVPVKYTNDSENKEPEYAYESDSGFDLRSTEDVWVQANDRKLIPTGLRFNIPDGYEIQVRSKSGLALNQGLMVLNSPGTVDCFSEDMKILTIDGEKFINEVNIGENIFSFNEDTLEIEKDTITQIYDTEIQEVLIIETDEGHLEVTPNTEIYTSKGIVLAKNLTENDEIIVFF
jgi:dUTP pyrophosphatase